MFLFKWLYLMASPWIMAEISAVTIYIQIFTIRSRWCLLLPFFPSNGVLLLLHPSSLLGLIALSFSSGWAGGESGRVGNVAKRGAPPHVRFIGATSRFSRCSSSSVYLVYRRARKDTPYRWEFYSSCIGPYFLLIISKKDKKAHFLFLNLQIW